MKAWNTVVMIVLALSIVACEGEGKIPNNEKSEGEKTQDNKSLSRKHAEDLLSSSEVISNRLLNSLVIQQGITKEYLASVKNCFLETGLLSKDDYEKNSSFIFTDEGKKEGLSVACAVYCKFKVVQENPGRPTKIEVTGIKDLPGSGECNTHKYVEFSYIYEGWSDKLNTCIRPTGKAAFALYDDGWRVDQVAFD